MTIRPLTKATAGTLGVLLLWFHGTQHMPRDAALILGCAFVFIATFLPEH